MIKTYIFILITFLCTSVAIYSRDYIDYLRKGNELYNSQKFNEAEREYRRAKEVDNSSLKADYNLGNSLYKQNNYQQAADYYYKTATGAKDNSTLAKAYHNLGNSFLQSKDYQKSIEAYKNALRINPDDQDTKYNLEYARQMLMQQQQNNSNQNQQNQQNQQQSQQDKQDKQNKQDKQQQNEAKDQDNQQDKQKQSDSESKISKEDAEHILNALKNEEKKLQKDLQRKKVGSRRALEKIGRAHV